MKHSDDVAIVDGGDVRAKLSPGKEVADYTWRGWKIWKAGNVSNLNLNGKEGYYAEHEGRGIWFTGERLSYVRMVLPDRDSISSERGGKRVPEGCHKTAERKRREVEDRPMAEKIAAAHPEVVAILQWEVDANEKLKRKFLLEAEENLSHTIRWAYDAVMHDMLGRLCKDLLCAPADKLPNAVVNRRRVYAEAMLEHTYSADSSGNLPRAVSAIEADAVKYFIKACDACIKAYERQGIKFDKEDYRV